MRYGSQRVLLLLDRWIAIRLRQSDSPELRKRSDPGAQDNPQTMLYIRL
jgi:hypothetical protein